MDQLNIQRLEALYLELKQLVGEKKNLDDPLLTFIKARLTTLESANELNWMLVRAVQSYDMRLIEAFARAEARVGRMHLDTQTAIHVAAKEGDSSVLLEWLFEMYDDINYIDSHGFSHFHAACKTSNIKRLESLWTKRVNVDAHFPYLSSTDCTALHLAVSAHQGRVVEWLVKRAGAKPNILDDAGLTPINSFCFRLGFLLQQDNIRPWIDTFNALLSIGADLDRPDKAGNSPLLNLFQHGLFMEANTRLQKFCALSLLQPNLVGVEVTRTNNKGQNVMHLIAARTGRCAYLGDELSSETQSHHDSIWKNLAGRLDANALDNDERTPLDYAVSNMNYYIVQKLLNVNTDLSRIKFQGGAFDPRGRQLRDYATMNNLIATIDYLMTKGLKWDRDKQLAVYRFFKGYTPMHPNLRLVLYNGSIENIKDYMEWLERRTWRKRFATVCLDAIWITMKIIEIGGLYCDQELIDTLNEKQQEYARRRDELPGPEIITNIKQDEFAEGIAKDIKTIEEVRLSAGATILDFCRTEPIEAFKILRCREDVIEMFDETKFPYISGFVRGHAIKSMAFHYVKQLELTWPNLTVDEHSEDS